jgi:hypothetical protein
MFKLSRLSLFTAAVILALLFSAFPLGAVMAEGEEPAPPEAPVTEEVPAVPEEAPPPVNETTPAAEDTPPTVEEVVAQVPDGVTVVPLDPVGEVLTLAAEATAKSYVTGDPVYCPQNVSFGDQCTHYDTIDEAINQSMTTDFGTVYVEVDYTDTNPAPLIIDGSYVQNTALQFFLIGGVDISTGNIVGRTKLTRQIVVNNIPMFNLENFSVTLPEITLPNIPEVVETAPAAFFADTTANISIIDSDFNNNPGPGITIHTTGPVSLFNVQSNNNGSGNVISNSSGDLFLTNSQFNGNQGTGLVATTDGYIFAVCNQAKNNHAVDVAEQDIEDGGGMYLQADGDITLWCNKVTGNGLFGLVAESVEGTIYLASNKISGNANVDFIPLSPTQPDTPYAPCSEICPSCSGGGSSGEEEKPSEGNTQVVIVHTGDGDGTSEIKPGYSTVFKLFDQERLVQLTALPSGSATSGSSALYTPLDEGTLPAPLPDGASLIPWGFNLSLTNPDGTPVESLIGYMLVRFYLPEGFVLPGGMRLMIQHFDTATSSWEPMSTAVGGGMAFTYATKPGTYVLTMEPIQ